jgi:serine/threonine protein kinase/tetratricopeptide (TPR) repeat protein
VAVTPETELPFRRLGRYEVLAPIAEGGMATVWLGRPMEPPRGLVALKVIRPEHARNKEFVAMLVDEARIASRLSHPNVVRLHGLGHEGRRHFLVMELLRGGTLQAAWSSAHARGKRLAYEVAAWIGARIADALEYAHDLKDEAGVESAQIVHRDVNPSNIFLAADGTPKLIDFGVARARDRIATTAAGVVKGKLAYLSPEQVEGHRADRRADIFALGVTLWELTLDRRLFREDDDVATIRRVREAQVPDPTTLDSGYPRPLAEALMRSLARDPRDRWQTAGHLRDALDSFVAQSARPVDAGSVRTMLAEVDANRSPAAWERMADQEEEPIERIRAWDDDRQKLTWMEASAEPIAHHSQNGSHPSVVEADQDEETVLARTETPLEALRRELAAREPVVRESRDRVAAARLQLERAIVEELLGDSGLAEQYAQQSLEDVPSPFAHAMLRRLGHAHGPSRALVAHIDAEIALLPSDAPRGAMLAERARVLDAAGEPADVVRAAWEAALAVDPKNGAALKGLEDVLVAAPGEREALATHLGRLAEAYGAEPSLAAQLLVRRAVILDAELSQPDAAKAALQRALAAEGALGPVRAACVAHAVAHRDAVWLVALLQEEAALETDRARAARLEVDAACLARRRLGDLDLAVVLFERALARGAEGLSVRRRALDELVTLHEGAGRTRDALRVRRLRLPLLDDPRVRAHELEAVAGLLESTGDARGAIAVLEQALALTPRDGALADSLDRLLEREGMTKERALLWTRLAAGAPDGPGRARRLVRAAHLANLHGDREQATLQLRAALVSDPTCDEAVDALLAMFSTPLSQAALDEVRARIAVHEHAAEHATDAARRVAHLEAIALLQEELLGDPAAAAKSHDAVLRVERRRSTALVGLARNSARSGDAAGLARALLEEAAASSGERAEPLRVRAAEVLRRTDAERSLAILREVLKRDPHREDAAWLEQRLHEDAGRWSQVDTAMAARIERTNDPIAQGDLWLARAQLQRTVLRSPTDALTSLRAALVVDPTHPAAREALVAQLEEAGDPHAIRDALVTLAAGEATAEGRARMLTRAAEIDELGILDDAAAADVYERALRETPDDRWVQERRARVQLRVERARTTPPHVEASTFATSLPKLGALWAQAALIQWKHPDRDDGSLVDAILALTPTDRAALDWALRTSLPRMRDGDPVARARASAALCALLEQPVGSETDRLCANLALALALDRHEGASDETRRGALACYRAALRIEPRCVTAASGAARLAAALEDVEAAVEAAVARSELALDAKQRAAHLVGAAGRIVSALDPRLGTRSERLARAGELLDRALEADPEALPAVGLLVAIRTEDGQRSRLLLSLRGAFERAKSTTAIAHLGGEIARAASGDSATRPVAIDALRRVLAEQPRHAPTLRALADLYVAQSAWGEAVDALEALATSARDAQTRLAAEFELADLYGRVLDRSGDAERALRAALEIDPASVRALRGLLTYVASAPERSQGELAGLLARLGDAETDPEGKSAALAELARLRHASGDIAGAEHALIEALAQSPTPPRLGRVAELYADPVAQARLLGASVARAQAVDRPQAATLAALGRLEVERLGRWSDGVAHLRAALTLAPTMPDARAALALGLLHLGVGAEAASMLLSMLLDEPGAPATLKDLPGVLSTLEGALAAEARHEEAIVARELRALCGGLDDGALVGLRSRRVAADASSAPGAALGAQLLRTSVVPREADSLLLEVAAALAGVEGKISQMRTASDGRAGENTGSFRLLGRGRPTPPAGHPVFALAQRLSSMFGVARPDIAVGEHGTNLRLVVQDAPCIVAPPALLDRPEPDIAAAMVPLLVRLALAVPWLDDFHGAEMHALLCGTARVVVPGYGGDLVDSAQSSRLDEMASRVGKVIGRRQKKALAELAPALGATKAPTVPEVVAWETALRRTELRAAFVATGDLLATVGAARARDESLAHATEQFGPAALLATLGHPLTGDLVRFALAPATTALRGRAGTLWTKT